MGSESIKEFQMGDFHSRDGLAIDFSAPNVYNEDISSGNRSIFYDARAIIGMWERLNSTQSRREPQWKHHRSLSLPLSMASRSESPIAPQFAVAET